MSGIQRGYGYQYETVAASQVDVPLGNPTSGGAAGDYLHRLIVTVNTAATSTVVLFDGLTSISLMPANVAVGVYSIEINAASFEAGWSITTGAGVTVVAVGQFS